MTLSILDLSLPGINGIVLCYRLRQDAQQLIPVIMLTAKNSVENKLEGFKSGADDYLTKPFSLAELAARVKVLSEHGNHTSAVQLLVEDLLLNTDTHEVNRAGKQINLNPKLFRLFLYLMQNPHRVVEREEIEYAVWQDNSPDSGALRTHLSNLHQVVDKLFDRPLLHRVRGFGYKLTGKMRKTTSRIARRIVYRCLTASWFLVRSLLVKKGVYFSYAQQNTLPPDNLNGKK